MFNSCMYNIIIYILHCTMSCIYKLIFLSFYSCLIVVQRGSLAVVGGVVKQWFWVPLVLGSLSALVFYYVFVRRRQSFRIYKH